MSHTVWFDAPLTCLACGAVVDGRHTSLHTNGLHAEATDVWVAAGETFDAFIGDFEDAYLVLRDPGDEADVRALEQWSCPACGWAQWARLDFHREDADHYRFLGARAVPLTPEVVREMHFLSRHLEDWVRYNPGEETDRLLPLIAHLIG